MARVQLMLQQSTPSMTCAPRRSAFSRARIFCVFVIAVLLGTASAQAATTLVWDPNPEPDIAGYKVSYGTQTGVYTTTIDVGKVTSWPVTSLTPGQRYFLAVRAYNTALLLSPPWRPPAARTG